MSSAVVLIDDEPTICRVLSIALKRLGRAVVCFTDPVAALAHIAAERPCLVICDHRMPGLTGLDVLERVPKDLPFILISGDLGARGLAARRAGVTAFLAKPFGMIQLLDTVAPLLG